MSEPMRALGLIETVGFVGVTEAADAAVKAAAVELAAIERIDGGMVSIRLLGDVGAVQAAVEAGVRAAEAVAKVVAQHVIPNPHEDLVVQFDLDVEGPISRESLESLSNADLETLSVARLRQLARTIQNLGIQGREISRANRDELIREIRQALEG